MSSTVLDLLIGLVYCYLIFSLLASATNEWYARLARLRAKMLREAIPILLGSNCCGKLGVEFHKHPLIQGIQVDPPYPTYIPPTHFALALIDLAFEVETTAPGLQSINVRKEIAGTETALTATETRLLESLVAQDTAIRIVQQRIEKWFEDSMERLSGKYKRKTYVSLLLISIVMSFLFGIDTIRLARELYSNQPLRQNLALAAQSDMKGTHVPLATLPIGHQSLTWTYVVGCLITGLAVTLGAPFWFDLLGRLVNLRQSGVPPDLKSKVVAQ